MNGHLTLPNEEEEKSHEYYSVRLIKQAATW